MTSPTAATWPNWRRRRRTGFCRAHRSRRRLSRPWRGSKNCRFQDRSRVSFNHLERFSLVIIQLPSSKKKYIHGIILFILFLPAVDTCIFEGLRVAGSRSVEGWDNSLGPEYSDTPAKCRDSCSSLLRRATVGQTGTPTEGGFAGCNSWSFDTSSKTCSLFLDDFETTKEEDSSSFAGPGQCS